MSERKLTKSAENRLHYLSAKRRVPHFSCSIKKKSWMWGRRGKTFNSLKLCNPAGCLIKVPHTHSVCRAHDKLGNTLFAHPYRSRRLEQSPHEAADHNRALLHSPAAIECLFTSINVFIGPTVAAADVIPSLCEGQFNVSLARVKLNSYITREQTQSSGLSVKTSEQP